MRAWLLDRRIWVVGLVALAGVSAVVLLSDIGRGKAPLFRPELEDDIVEVFEGVKGDSRRITIRVDAKNEGPVATDAVCEMKVMSSKGESREFRVMVRSLPPGERETIRRRMVFSRPASGHSLDADCRSV